METVGPGKDPRRDLSVSFLSRDSSIMDISEVIAAMIRGPKMVELFHVNMNIKSRD